MPFASSHNKLVCYTLSPDAVQHIYIVQCIYNKTQTYVVSTLLSYVAGVDSSQMSTFGLSISIEHVNSRLLLFCVNVPTLLLQPWPHACETLSMKQRVFLLPHALTAR